jgi:hypothetical protein
MNNFGVPTAILIEKQNGLQLPYWANENYFKIISMNDAKFYFRNYYEEMGRIHAGGILNDMNENIKLKMKPKRIEDKMMKLELYSAHDTNVAALTKLLNLTTFINAPPYTSSVVIELHSAFIQNDTKWFVKAFLKNNTDSEKNFFIPMTIYGDKKITTLSFLNFLFLKLYLK